MRIRIGLPSHSPSRVLLTALIAVSLLASAASGQTGEGLDRLLQSPLDRQADDVFGGSRRPHGFAGEARWPGIDVEPGVGHDSRSAYGTYYRFGARVPGFYSDRTDRFWSNSYGGPWYYPGSPANTRSSWMDWTPTNW